MRVRECTRVPGGRPVGRTKRRSPEEPGARIWAGRRGGAGGNAEGGVLVRLEGVQDLRYSVRAGRCPK